MQSRESSSKSVTLYEPCIVLDGAQKRIQFFGVAWGLSLFNGLYLHGTRGGPFFREHHSIIQALISLLLQDIAILMYKVKYGLAPSIVNELFKRKSTLSSYSLRNSDFDIPTFNTIDY